MNCHPIPIPCWLDAHPPIAGAILMVLCIGLVVLIIKFIPVYRAYIQMTLENNREQQQQAEQEERRHRLWRHQIRANILLLEEELIDTKEIKLEVRRVEALRKLRYLIEAHRQWIPMTILLWYLPGNFIFFFPPAWWNGFLIVYAVYSLLALVWLLYHLVHWQRCKRFYKKIDALDFSTSQA